MNIDFDSRTVDFKNTLMLKNDDTAIRVNGNGLGNLSFNIEGMHFNCRVNKSKVITKIKWIIAVIKFKI